MKGFAAFFKKEWLENWHNHRLLILTALFLIFGITNAPLAKYTPELLAALADGFTLDAAPVALDAWTQFFKNASSLGMSIVIILFGSTLANEYSRGTLVLLVTKGLSRRAVILAKYVVSVLIMSGCYWLCYVLTYGYTAYYWPGNALPHTALAAAALWVLGLLYLALTLLGGVLFRQTFTAIVFTGGIVALLSLVNLVLTLALWNPLQLGAGTALISGEITPADLVAPLVVSLGLTLLALVVAVKRFDQRGL